MRGKLTLDWEKVILLTNASGGCEHTKDGGGTDGLNKTKCRERGVERAQEQTPEGLVAGIINGNGQHRTDGSWPPGPCESVLLRK